MSYFSEQVFGLVGKRSNKKHLIIESDDWGLTLMPSKASYAKLLSSGIPVDICPYNTYDSLETEKDIEFIHEFCESFKDYKGQPLQITANFIMANPDFDIIKESDYEQYHYHDLRSTYLKYQGGLQTLEAIKEAYQLGTFQPQLHGREHLQVNHWLRALRRRDSETLLAFDAGVYGHPSVNAAKTGVHFLSAFHISSKEELTFAGHSVVQAASMFRDTFGLTSKTFIAPRYIWPTELEPYFKQAGIKALQGTLVQLQPKIGKSSVILKKRINWMGRRNAIGLNYLTRNVFFEPTLNPDFSWEADAMRRIETAFFWGKPAIISMHRLNFMGGFSEGNRINGLKRLRILLKRVQEKYSDIEFCTSDNLFTAAYE